MVRKIFLIIVLFVLALDVSVGQSALIEKVQTTTINKYSFDTLKLSQIETKDSISFLRTGTNATIELVPIAQCGNTNTISQNTTEYIFKIEYYNTG